MKRVERAQAQVWPWEIEDAKKVGSSQFLFIDDFLGTGDQFCGFAQQFNLSTSLQGCYAVYAPLAAHKDGISAVQNYIPDLHVVTVEAIDNSYSLFSDKSPWFNDGLNSPNMARDYYDTLVARLHLPVTPDALRGYGKLPAFGKLGDRLHTFVFRLGSLFALAHKRPTQSEPEQSHFAITSGSKILSEEDTRFLREAEKWSVIFAEEETKLKSDSQPASFEYVLNPVYSPYFNISRRLLA